MSPPLLIIGNFLSEAGGSRGASEEFAERLRGNGCGVLTTSWKPAKIARLADMMMTVIKRRRDYAVAQVNVYSGSAFFWAEATCAALRLLGKPYVLTLHGGNLPEFAASWPRRVGYLLTSAKAVTAPSGYLKQRLDPYCADEIRVIPNPIEVEAYAFRERGPVRPNLVWLRAFHNIYDPMLAVKVLDALTTRYSRARLTMVGPDKTDGSLQQTRMEAKRAGLDDRIAFLGHVSKKDVPQILGGGDVFLNTTKVDNTPVSVIEAMACGLCVVSTRVGGTPFLISNEEDGLLVRCGDARAMASAVRRFLEAPAFARSCSQNARRKVEKWNWTNVLGEWERLFSTVCSSGEADLTAKCAKGIRTMEPMTTGPRDHETTASFS